jgi:3-phosphoshikimate 1-carboxyvinyltransferase
MNCHIPKNTLSTRPETTITTIPGDKSLSHRAVILGSLAEGRSTFSGFLTAEDCLNSLKVFKSLGIEATQIGTDLSVHGKGLSGLRAPKTTLDVGNSGTGIRLITGVLAAQAFDTQITGDASIQKRPMKRIITPLSLMGAQITGQSLPGKTDIYPMLSIQGGQLNAITYTLPVASAQVKSAILLASLFSKDVTTVIEPEATRDHTERMLQGYGADIRREGTSIMCSGRKPLIAPQGRTIQIPADISSAAFFIVLGLITPHQGLHFTHVGINPTRDALLNVLKAMGANINIHSIAGEDFEPHATISVYPSEMTNIDLDPTVIPFLIDEIPILAVAAMFAKGTLRVTGAKELRVKESDRIAAIARIAAAIGVTLNETDDGFSLTGRPQGANFTLDSHGDHRIAMSGIVLAYAAEMSATVIDCACIQTSFPNFFEILTGLGVECTLES